MPYETVAQARAASAEQRAAAAGLLAKSRHLLLSDTWCQGKMFADTNGRRIRPVDGNSGVGRVSAVGAVRMVHRALKNDEQSDERELACFYLADSLRVLEPEFIGAVEDWNDCPGRTKEEVIKLFSHAIETLNVLINTDTDQAGGEDGGPAAA